MIVGIDASNLRAGGGVTHLVELLNAAVPHKHRFNRIIVWAGKSTLDQIEDREWIDKSHYPILDKNLILRLLWQRFLLPRIAIKAGCNILLVPGGTYTAKFTPVVTMSRNMLPFQWSEVARYGLSWMMLKLALLRVAQSSTFQRVDGIIFLTNYAYETIKNKTRKLAKHTSIIPHGVDARFFQEPKYQHSIDEYSETNPFRVIYVSQIDMYKHQWNVAKAIAILRKCGIPIEINFVGSSYPPAYRIFKKTMSNIPNSKTFIQYKKFVPNKQIQSLYKAADMCIFASTCENMPNILLEGMASGLPIACSNRGPMPEVLGEAGIYFDPDNINAIVSAISKLIHDKHLRTEKANKAYYRAQQYSWDECANSTFGFLSKLSKSIKRS